MIVDNGKYYLYRHIRLDTNEPFYIGIGTKQFKTYNCINCEYGRANGKVRRTNFWNNIVNKTEYEVEVLLESDNYDFIKQKEIEFISLYGRKDLNTGNLVNLTVGGDSVTEKLKRFGEDNYAARKILQYDLQGNFLKEWNSMIQASNFYNISHNKVKDCIRLNKNKDYNSDIYRTSENYIWLYFKENYSQSIIVQEKCNGSYKRAKKVYQYDLEGNFLKEWLGRDVIAKHYKWNRETTGNFFKKDGYYGKGFIWTKLLHSKQQILDIIQLLPKEVLSRRIT